MYVAELRKWQKQRNVVFKVMEDKDNSIGCPYIYFITHHLKFTTSGGLAKLPLYVCVYLMDK